MKALSIALILIAAAYANANEESPNDPVTWLVNGSNATKVEAVKAKVLDPGVSVKRCVDQELSEKLTFKAKKKPKK
jgi:hypothetical protein